MLFAALVFVGCLFVYEGWRHRYAMMQKRRQDGESDKIVYPKWYEIISSLFAVIGAGEYAYLVVLILGAGFYGNSFLIGLACSLFLIAFAVKKKAWTIISEMVPNAAQYEHYISITTPEFFNYTFGRPCAILATVLTALAFFGLLVLQFTVGGAIIEAITGYNIKLCIFLIMAVTCLYTCMGGFFAIYRTDSFQKILMWVGLISVVVFAGWGLAQGYSDKYWMILNSSFSTKFLDVSVIPPFLITLVAAFAGPDFWQRISMNESENSAAFRSVISGVAMIIFAFVFTLFVAHVQLMQELVPSIAGAEDKFIAYLQYVVGPSHPIGDKLALPVYIRFLFAMGLLAAFISTADTSAMLFATSIQNEFGRSQLRNFVFSKNSKLANMGITRALVAAACVAGYFVATELDTIAAIFIQILSVLSVMGLPIILMLLGFGNKKLCFVALILGLALNIFFMVAGDSIDIEYKDTLIPLIPMTPGFLLLFSKDNPISRATSK